MDPDFFEQCRTQVLKAFAFGVGQCDSHVLDNIRSHYRLKVFLDQIVGVLVVGRQFKAPGQGGGPHPLFVLHLQYQTTSQFTGPHQHTICRGASFIEHMSQPYTIKLGAMFLF